MLPQEYPLKPGEKPPKVRQRIGTAFRLDEKTIVSQGAVRAWLIVQRDPLSQLVFGAGGDAARPTLQGRPPKISVVVFNIHMTVTSPITDPGWWAPVQSWQVHSTGTTTCTIVGYFNIKAKEALDP